MRLLITRPGEDAQDLERALKDLGHDAIVEPLLKIVPSADAAVPDRAYQAVLVTSANGVRSLAARADGQRLRDTRVLAVGRASARAAEASGFVQVEDAGGDLEALAELVGQSCEPAAGPLFYAAGRVVSGDLKGRLEGQGFDVDRVVLYEAVEAERLSAATVEQLAAGVVDGLLLYSPRTARIWVALCERAGLTAAAGQLTHYCLAQSVADALSESADWPASSVRVASRPDQQALLEIL